MQLTMQSLSHQSYYVSLDEQWLTFLISWKQFGQFKWKEKGTPVQFLQNKCAWFLKGENLV